MFWRQRKLSGTQSFRQVSLAQVLVEENEPFGAEPSLAQTSVILLLFRQKNTILDLFLAELSHDYILGKQFATIKQIATNLSTQFDRKWRQLLAPISAFFMILLSISINTTSLILKPFRQNLHECDLVSIFYQLMFIFYLKLTLFSNRCASVFNVFFFEEGSSVYANVIRRHFCFSV